MNKYIIELLKIQNSVIIPGFGALMVPSQKSGKVVFNPLLKFNDGSLAKFISDMDGVDIQEATNQIAKFVREIEAELSQGNSYDVFQLGKFTKNSEGQIDFVMQPDIEFTQNIAATEKPVEKTPTKTPEIIKETPVSPVIKSEAEIIPAETIKEEIILPPAPVDPIKIKEEVVTPAEPIIPPIKTAEIKEIVQIEEITHEERKATVKEPKQQKNIFIPLDPSNVEQKAEISDKVTPISSTPSDTSAPKAQKPNSRKKEAPKKAEKKKRSNAPWIILLLLILGLGITGYLYKDTIVTYFNSEEAAVTADPIPTEEDQSAITEKTINEALMEEIAAQEEQEQETIEELAAPSVETKKVSEPTKSATSSSASGNYHIIGNSFSEKENAERYMNEMNGKGYNAKIIGRFDELYLVAINSFDTREAASNKRNAISNDIPGAWIFKY